MITEQDLRAAIAECEGERNPNANTCIKLAAFYTIRRELYGAEPAESTRVVLPAMSHDAPAIPFSESEFSEMVSKVGIEVAFPVIDELMETLAVINGRLYDSVMRKLASAKSG